MKRKQRSLLASCDCKEQQEQQEVSDQQRSEAEAEPGGERGREGEKERGGRLARLREQQMGFGTALPGSVPSLLRDLQLLLQAQSQQQALSEAPPPSVQGGLVLCDIGAGCGNILSDVQDSGVLLPLSPLLAPLLPSPPPPRLWGVEMNLAFTSQTPERWRDLIYWCKLEELQEQELAGMGNGNGTALLKDTNIAYMYDLCLKRLTRKAKLQKEHYKRKNNLKKRKNNNNPSVEDERVEEEEDPHWLIQQVLLSSSAMPALRYFISTYSPAELGLLPVDGGDASSSVTSRSSNMSSSSTGAMSVSNTWNLVLQKKLPCSTDSYMFFVYERVPVPIVPMLPVSTSPL